MSFKDKNIVSKEEWHCLFMAAARMRITSEHSEPLARMLKEHAECLTEGERDHVVAEFVKYWDVAHMSGERADLNMALVHQYKLAEDTAALINDRLNGIRSQVTKRDMISNLQKKCESMHKELVFYKTTMAWHTQGDEIYSRFCGIITGYVDAIDSMFGLSCEEHDRLRMTAVDILNGGDGHAE